MSIELPPPRPTSRSGAKSRATAVPSSTSAEEGFSPNAEKISGSMAASASDSVAAAT